jgi:hypothetical protein
MRPLVFAFVAALVVAPGVSAQQAVDQPAAQQEAVTTTEAVSETAVPSTVKAPANGLSDLETVQPSFEVNEASEVSQSVDNRTRNILAIVGAVVIVLALIAFVG